MGICYDHIGVEVELSTTPKDTADRLLRNLGVREYFNLTGDASIESKVVNLAGGLQAFDPEQQLKSMAMSTSTVGVELVSVPLSPADYQRVITTLMMGLGSIGELSRSFRASIHIHVGFPHSISLLKRVIIFAKKFESLLYRLGNMGYKFRGYSNRAIYCRPFSTKYGPPITQCSNGKLYPITVVDDLLRAENVEEFWSMMGISVRNPNRYHPARYFGLNILSILLHGTLEFRFFNFTTNPRYVVAAGLLCHAITELISTVPLVVLDELEDSSVFEEHDDLRLMEMLLRLISAYNQNSFFPEEYKQDLYRMISSTDPVILAPGYVQTHLWDKFLLPSEYLEYGTKTPVSLADVKPSGFVDSHNFQPKFVNLLEIMK